MRNIFVMLAIATLSFSCKKTTKSNCGDTDANCTAVRCFVHNYYFDFRIVDKVTGADLIFGNNPRYTASDVKLYFDVAKLYPMKLFIDSSTQSFRTMSAKEEMYMTIGSGGIIKLTAEFRMTACCTSRVKSLEVAGQSLCGCCSDVISVPVN